ncbi:TPA: EamA family transporter [archaeon]|nr:EamA family transporter [Candidatus Naiadarchaeales archaeon SRR2090153.bin461]
MESWVIYGIAALVLFGIANFLLKLISDKVPAPLFATVYLGIAFATAAAIFLFQKTPISFPGNTMWITVLAGIILGTGIIATTIAFSLGLGSKVVTVININTLVTVSLLVLILGEKLTPKIGAGILFALVSLYLLTS